MKLIFEKSVAGRGMQYLPGCDVEEVALPASLVRNSGFISRTYFLHDLQQDHFHSGFSICADRGDNTRTFFIIMT